jgi:hypothetical protein
MNGFRESCALGLMSLAQVLQLPSLGVARLAAWVMPQPPEPTHCARCGYNASANTVLIPAGLCPSCGALLVAQKGSSRS